MRIGVGIALALALCAADASRAAAEVKEGDRAPELKGVKTGTGKKARIGQFKGRVVVLSFGASWCEPCKKELPALGKLSRKLRAMKSKAVVITINTDDELDVGQKFMRGFDLGCAKAGYDSNQQAVGIYGPKTQPSTYVIDGNGIVRHIHAGYRPGDEDTIAAWVDKLER